MAEKIAVSITFDENNSIRVLDSEKFKETDNIRNECNEFLKSGGGGGERRDDELQRDGEHAGGGDGHAGRQD